MMKFIRVLTTSIAIFALTWCANAQDRKHFLDIETPGGVLPVEFEMEFGLKPDGRKYYNLINGTERIEANLDQVASADVELEDVFYKTVSRMRVDGFQIELFFKWVNTLGGLVSFDEMEWRARTGYKGSVGRASDKYGAWTGYGVLRMNRRSGPVDFPLAVSHRMKRFPLPDEPSTITSGRYTVTFSSSPDKPAIGVFNINKDGTATGTFMTTTGDYRYLAGNAAGDTLKLSTFDGAHAFLFHAERQDDGSLKGDFWSGNWWHETWTAKFDADAKLPDPFAQTKYQGDTASLERLDFRALDGTPTPVGVLAPSGSPRVVIVFGSWCPNCHDATRLLTEFDKTYGPRGLKILGLAFEHSSDHKKAAQSVRTFADDLGVEYPILIAGLSEKDKASDALPILDRVRSYPTTLFIDADGTIRAVHSGFTGPATGDEYTELRARFVAIIESMLKDAQRLDMPGPDD